MHLKVSRHLPKPSGSSARILTLSLGCICTALALACGGDPSSVTSAAPVASDTPAANAVATTAPTAQSQSGSAGSANKAVVVAQDMAFVNTVVTARAGEVTLVLQNNQLFVRHDIRADGFPGSAFCQGVCETSTTFNAGPGSYRFVCTEHPVTMFGTLTLVP